jgi:hypothetical protein
MPEILIIAAIALLIWWAIRRKWITGGHESELGTPPHQPGERFRDYEENRQRHLERKEVDRILEKIAQSGIDSLTAKEKALLEEAAKREKRHQPTGK